MRKYVCDICHSEITRYQSWHDTGYSLAHIACETRSVPSSKPSTVYRASDSVWFESDEKENAARKRFVPKAIV